ncbi:MAG: glycosyltransferase family 9 protein [Deltaproteobacteria bacterium]|nr:glycosyltransferase family 9 protein [Deltaproteobacteria bacterium]
MNIDLVRKIDYWAGIPACWLLTLVNRLIKPLSRRPPPSPEKFLFIELSEMGSAILAYPAMKVLKKAYPSAELFFLIFEKNRASVDILKMIPKENVLVIREKSPFYFLIDCLRVIFRMRREEIDCVFDLELFARITAIFSYLSAAPIRVGFHKFRMEGLYRGRLHTHWIQYNFQQHISKSFLSFVRVLDYPEKNWPALEEIITEQAIETASYQASEFDAAGLRKKLQLFCPEIESGHKLVLLNPSAGEIPIRAWPIAKYIELAERLLSDPKTVVILIGAGADWETTQKVHQTLNHTRCVQFTGQTTFAELMVLFSISDLLITNDSGPAHFASLTGIKNFVFFGPETPRLYAPLGKNTQILYADFPCSPCLTAYNHRNTPCRDNKCLQGIPVDEVYALAKRHLAGD